MLNFIFAHLNAIALGMWAVFFCVVLVRSMCPLWVKNISYKRLILSAVALHVFYAVFVTWGQYHVWALGSDFTRSLLALPLPVEAPLPGIFEWTRAYFDQPLGYFAYYAFGRFFLNTLVLFAVALLLYVVFRIWDKRRGGFGEHGPEILFVLMLISGWPGMIVLILFGFMLALTSFALPLISTRNPLSLERAFLIATPFVLLLARPILIHLHLLALLSV